MMEESSICRIGVKARMLCKSQSKNNLQHRDSNPGGRISRHSLEEDEGNICITKNRSLASPVYCIHVSGEGPPGPEGGTDPSDSQQDTKCNRDEGQTLGKDVLLLMQALSTLSTPEEKLAVLCKKYIDLLEDNRNNQRGMTILKKTQAQIMKETVHLHSKYSKATLVRSKLKSLCRELQCHNKTLKEENMQQAREEEESHRKATSHFQFTLNEIEVQLEWCEIPNAKLHQENIELREKLKTLTGRCTLSKEDIDKVLNHKGLEHQLVAKLQQTTQLIQETDEKHQREREFLLKEATESRHRYEEMKRQEVHLKQQISLYMDKFEDFQTILTRRSELFTTFRQEVEKMTKKTAKMEKKMIVWRTKREDNNKVLLQMAEEKTIRDKEHRTFQMKLKRLEKLFRALQMERNELCEKVEVLKKKDSVKEADVNLATHVIQPHTALDSQKELNTSSKRAPGVYLRVEPKSVKKTKRRSKAPFHMT